ESIHVVFNDSNPPVRTIENDVGEDDETSSHHIEISRSEERHAGETSNLDPSVTLNQSEIEDTESIIVSKFP
ncbi:hypothetical protein HAX54_046347, partial [Datura stramonium]|nr:hypothetical protein [Datura stramonium]